MTTSRDWILWLDCLGGLLVGVLVLLGYPFLVRIEGLPESTVISMGVANLIYGAFSLFVTTRQRRHIGLVRTLALANMAWLAVCVGIVVRWFNTATAVGVLLIVGEGVYVAALGLIEWTWRAILATSTRA